MLRYIERKVHITVTRTLREAISVCSNSVGIEIDVSCTRVKRGCVKMKPVVVSFQTIKRIITKIKNCCDFLNGVVIDNIIKLTL